MVVNVRRDGNEWQQTYGQGKATSKVTKVSTEKVRGSGTTVRFRPDPEIFGKLAFDADEIRERLEAKTYLHRGLRVVFVDETKKPPVREEYAHDGGLADYLLKVVAERGEEPDPRERLRPSSATPTRGSSSPSSGPRRPTSTSGRGSTASRPRRAARTRTA